MIEMTSENSPKKHSAALSRRWTWSWYLGRMRYELRWLPRGVKRVLRGESRWYAPLRCLFHALVLMDECEICAVCGHPVGAVWHAEDELWMRVNGRYSGTTCVSCFNKQAVASGASPYWEVHDGNYPTCTGNPCAHIAPMRIQADCAAEYWAALVEVCGERDAAAAVVDRLRSKDEAGGVASGLWPVTERGLQPAGMVCMDCGDKFEVGDVYAQRPTEQDDVVEIVCVGCRVLNPEGGFDGGS